MTETHLKWFMTAGVVLTLAAGCGKRDSAAIPDEPAPVEPPPLVRVGDRVISEDDFNREVQRRIATGRPVQDTESVLEEMIERETFLHKAALEGVEDDPEVRRSLENQLLSHWLEETLQREKNAVSVSDDELRAAYEANLQAHTRPAMIRVAMLYRAVTPGMSDEEKNRLRDELESARREFLQDPAAATQNGRISGFGSIAASATEDTVSRYRGGDLGWHEAGRDQYRWPLDVMEAAFALPVGQPGEVMELEDGLYVMMKSAEQEARVTPFEEAKVLMRRGMIREKQQAIEASFRARIKEDVTIEVNQEQASRLALPPAPPAPVPPSLSRATSTPPGPELLQP